MSRAKKDAGEALKELGHYLRRDPGATKKVDAISRYVGELRQTVATIKAELDASKKQLASLRDHTNDVERQLGETRDELSKEQARHHQTKLEKARPTHVEEPLRSLPVVLQDKKGFLQSFKIVKKYSSRPPRILGYAAVLKSKVQDDRLKRMPDILVCRLEDVIHVYEPRGLESVGRMVAFAAMLGIGLTFVVEQPFNDEDAYEMRDGEPGRWMWSRWIPNAEKRQLLEGAADFARMVDGNDECMRQTTFRDSYNPEPDST
jgi:hypothetical protein